MTSGLDLETLGFPQLRSFFSVSTSKKMQSLLKSGVLCLNCIRTPRGLVRAQTEGQPQVSDMAGPRMCIVACAEWSVCESEPPSWVKQH